MKKRNINININIKNIKNIKNINLFQVAKIIIFIISIFSMTILGYLNYAPKERLYIENRKKAQLPKIFKEKNIKSVKNINRKFVSEFEKFYSDNFYKKDDILKTKMKLDLDVLNKPLIGDVIYNKSEDLILEKREKEEIPKDNFDKIININNELKKQNIPFIVVGIPRQSIAFLDKYPKYVNNESKDYEIKRDTFYNTLSKNNIDYINMEEYLKQDPKKYYPKGDHHYNLTGALKTYEKIVEKINSNYFPYESQIKNLKYEKNENLIGHLKRKMGSLRVKEDLTTAIPNRDIPYDRYDYKDGKLEKVTPFINMDNTNSERVYYDTYMGGNNANTVIDTHRPELKNILIVGDSTTNPLETLFWINANKMISIDFRHYEEKGILDYIKENKVDIVIFSMTDGSYSDLNEILK